MHSHPHGVHENQNENKIMKETVIHKSHYCIPRCVTFLWITERADCQRGKVNGCKLQRGCPCYEAISCWQEFWALRPQAICSKLAPTQGALRSGHQWSDTGVLLRQRRTARVQLNDNRPQRQRWILDTGRGSELFAIFIFYLQKGKWGATDNCGGEEELSRSSTFNRFRLVLILFLKKIHLKCHKKEKEGNRMKENGN